MMVVLRSNQICVRASMCDTMVIRYRDNRNAWNFGYVGNSFEQQCRIPVTLQNPVLPVEENVYTKHDGTIVNTGSRVKKKYTLVTDQAHIEFHEALAIAVRHSDVYLDDIRYQGTAEYELEPNDFNNLQQGKSDVFVQGYNQTNITC
jgi:hypothetical protein